MPASLVRLSALWRSGEGRGLVSQGGLAIRIERLHVLQNQVQALKLTRKLSPQLRTQRAAIAGPQL